ncbi:MAG TPA: hypothetical protein DC064_12360, partial [Cyanobacteria bacterium UBA9273]|nr:hypothetical protein [Cyanobacteria bacterium UBA9273]
MATSPIFKQFCLTPAIIFSSFFCALGLPFLIFAAKPIQINLQEEPVFQGELKDFTVAYFCFSTLLSLAACCGYITVIGWKLSASKSAIAAKQLSDLQLKLKTKQAELEEWELLQFKNQTTGLNLFLEADGKDEVPIPSPKEEKNVDQGEESIIVIEKEMPICQPLLIDSSSSISYVPSRPPAVASLP